MTTLNGKMALVTGASSGIAKDFPAWARIHLTIQHDTRRPSDLLLTDHVRTIYDTYISDGGCMGLVKIDDDLHEQVRRASTVMCRSINAQAEFWMKVGMLAEANPTMSFNDIVKAQFEAADVSLRSIVAA